MSRDFRQFVIVGMNPADATSEYRRLVEEEFERIAGMEIRIALPYASSLQGLYVDGYSITPRVEQHPNYEAVVDTLQASYVRGLGPSPKNGDK